MISYYNYREGQALFNTVKVGDVIEEDGKKYLVTAVSINMITLQQEVVYEPL